MLTINEIAVEIAKFTAELRSIGLDPVVTVCGGGAIVFYGGRNYTSDLDVYIDALSYKTLLAKQTYKKITGVDGEVIVYSDIIDISLAPAYLRPIAARVNGINILISDIASLVLQKKKLHDFPNRAKTKKETDIKDLVYLNECTTLQLKGTTMFVDGDLKELIGNPNESKTHQSVLQDWVTTLPIMQQSVLLGAIRGPDGMPKYSAAKMLLRWYRRCVLISAFDKCVLTTPTDPRGGSFTGPSVSEDVIRANPRTHWTSFMESVIDDYFVEYDSLPGHFTKHFMMACEILGYKHPDPVIQTWWKGLYFSLVSDAHLGPETCEEMDRRLSDDRTQWLMKAEQATAR